MAKVDPNAAAFPAPVSVGDVKGADGPIWIAGSRSEQPGLTIRTWLAGQAMAGFLASFAVEDVENPAAKSAAEYAVGYADALIAELNEAE